MRKGPRRMWWEVGSRSKKGSTRSESRMDIEEILKMKLETITEEPETSGDENGGQLVKHHQRRNNVLSKVSKIQFKMKIGKIFASQLRPKESYVLFMMTGFAVRF